jgi:RHS repeat-associated protein
MKTRNILTLVLLILTLLVSINGTLQAQEKNKERKEDLLLFDYKNARVVKSFRAGTIQIEGLDSPYDFSPPEDVDATLDIIADPYVDHCPEDLNFKKATVDFHFRVGLPIDDLTPDIPMTERVEDAIYHLGEFVHGPITITLIVEIDDLPPGEKECALGLSIPTQPEIICSKDVTDMLNAAYGNISITIKELLIPDLSTVSPAQMKAIKLYLYENIQLDAYFTAKVDNLTYLYGEEITGVPSLDFKSPVYLKPFTGTDYPVVYRANGTPVLFEWGLCSECDKDDYDNYQIQILKLLPTKFEIDHPEFYYADWSKALTFETGSSEQSVELILTEGSGYYIWRVRPISNQFPGGIANNQNWGNWSQHVNDCNGEQFFLNRSHLVVPGLEQIFFDSPNSPLFFYKQFEDDKNWKHTRYYSEGDGYGLRKYNDIQYADYLLNPRQSTTLLKDEDGNNYALTSQTVLDNVGRPIINSLPVPLYDASATEGGLAYKDLLLKVNSDLYTADDFDNELNYRGDYGVNSGTVFNYYDGDNVYAEGPFAAGYEVPSAMNQGSSYSYPFSRTIFKNDGTGRAIEQSGVGETYKIGNVVGLIDESKTSRIFYSTPTEKELLRVFGNETPDIDNVKKIVTFDPNNVASIQYMDKNGNVLASCLSYTQGYVSGIVTDGGEDKNVLQDLTTTTSFDGTTNEYDVLEPATAATTNYIINKEKIDEVLAEGGSILEMGETFDLLNPSTLCSLKYNIDEPKVTLSYCGTDYAEYDNVLDLKVSFKFVENNTGKPYTIDDVLNPTTAANPDRDHVFQNPDPGELPAGVYTITRYLELNEEYKKHIKEHFQDQFDAKLYGVGGVGGILMINIDLDPFDGVTPVPLPSINILDYLSDETYDPNNIKIINLEALWDALSDHQKWIAKCGNLDDPTTEIDESTIITSFEAKVSDCCTLIIDEVLAPSSCGELITYDDDGNPDYQFEKYLHDKYDGLMIKDNLDANGDAITAVDLRSYFRRFGGFHYRDLDGNDETNNNIQKWIDCVGDGDFDLLIRHMINDPSECYNDEQLCRAWKQVVNELQYAAWKYNVYGDLLYTSFYHPDVGTLHLPEFKDNYDLLEAFLNKVGTIYGGFVTASFDNCSTEPYFSNYLQNAYKYVYISDNDYDELTDTPSGDLVSAIEMVKIHPDAPLDGSNDLILSGDNCGFNYTSYVEDKTYEAVWKAYYSIKLNGVGGGGTAQARETGDEFALQLKNLTGKDQSIWDHFRDFLKMGCDERRFKLEEKIKEYYYEQGYKVYDFKYVKINGVDVEYTPVKYVPGIDWSLITVISEQEIECLLDEYSGHCEKLSVDLSKILGHWKFRTSITPHATATDIITKYSAAIQRFILMVGNDIEIVSEGKCDENCISYGEDDHDCFTLGDGIWEGLEYNGLSNTKRIEFISKLQAAIDSRQVALINSIDYAAMTSDDDGNTLQQIRSKLYPSGTLTDEDKNKILYYYSAMPHIRFETINIINGVISSFNNGVEEQNWVKPIFQGFDYIKNENSVIKDQIDIYENNIEAYLEDLDDFLEDSHPFPNFQDGYYDQVEAFDFQYYNSYDPFGIIKIEVDNPKDFFSEQTNLIDPRFGRLLLMVSHSPSVYNYYDDEGTINDRFTLHLNSVQETPTIVPSSVVYNAIESHLLISYKLDLCGTSPMLAGQENYSKYINMPLMDFPEGKIYSGQGCFRQLCCRWVPKEIEPRKPYDVVRKSIDGFKGDVILSDLYAQIKECNEKLDFAVEEMISEIENGNFLSDKNEELTLEYIEADKYHYTLYYYDRQGNLVKTIPPRGVDVDEVVRDRSDTPDHEFKSEYAYNSFGQMIEKTSPDEAGDTEYHYNDFGQLRFSQNPQQAADLKYSYTIYDDLGRVIEVGEAQYSSTVNLDAMCEITYSTDGTPSHITPYDELHDIAFFVMTVYGDEVAPHQNKGATGMKAHYADVVNLAKINKIDGCPSQIYSSNYTRRNLRNRINFVIRDEDGICEYDADNFDDYDRTITYYSYDLHGNVSYIIQNVPTHHKKTIRPLKIVSRLVTETKYSYDLISGKVNKVEYCDKLAESFKHKYEYDELNRLVEVKTSRFGKYWDTDAIYFYYPHGPLKRIEMGDDQLQGLDYTYTINGWLKAVNNSNSGLQEPGLDGSIQKLNSINPAYKKFIEDGFGYVMNYNNEDYYHQDNTFDYNSTSGSRITSSAVAGSRDLTFPNLYNGNIGGISYGFDPDVISQFSANLDNEFMAQNASDGIHNIFQYDVLNRLVKSYEAFYDRGVLTLNDDDRYNTSYEYDASGNILGLKRNVFEHTTGDARMDNLTYNYTDGTNQLESVEESINHGQTTFQIKDIDYASYNTSYNNAYRYDKIGNLTEDYYEHIEKITWTPDGKVRSIKYDFGIPENTDKCVLEFTYDGMGNRVRKTMVKSAMSYENAEKIMVPYLDPCCDDGNPGNDEFFRALTFENTYYARGANGKVKAVYNLVYENKTIGDIGYKCPDFFKTSTSGETTDIYGDELDIMGQSTPADVPAWLKPDDTPILLGEYDDFYNHIELYKPKIAEWYIYGSGAQGRFASRSPEYNYVLYQGPPDHCYSEYEIRPIGLKKYEITDHLGNPRVIFNDIRLEFYQLVEISQNNYQISYLGYEPRIVPLEMNNYFPFGMLKEGMNANDGLGYRYGFNGMERDNESKGFGNDLSTFFRGYDPRLARWKSKDPLTKAFESCYVGFANNPVYFLDPKGNVNESMHALDQKFAESFYTLGTRMTTEEKHMLMDAFGLEPTIGGALVDGLHSVWLLLEGDFSGAGLTAVAIIPGLDIVKGGKYTKYVYRYMNNAGKSITRSTKCKKYYDNFSRIHSAFGSKIANTMGDAGKFGWSNKLKKVKEIAAEGKKIAGTWQAHHLIPTELIEKSATLRKAIKDGFDFNGAINGKALSTSRHWGSHPNAYVDGVADIIRDIRMKNPDMKAKEIMERAASRIRKKIESTDKKVNEIF